ncbi:MAG: alpha/beta hydrolase-fold protein [Chitinophagales bacterium]
MLTFKKIIDKLFGPKSELIFTSKIGIKVYQLHLHSQYLKRNVLIDVYLPPHYFLDDDVTYPTLYFNDGQDMEAVNLVHVLEDLYVWEAMQKIVVVAIHAQNRMKEYGTAAIADYKNRGNKAAAYTDFMLKELLPFIEMRGKCSAHAMEKAIAGFSLGGLSAMDIAWHHPDQFSKIGVFSGSFWWHEHDLPDAEIDQDRIMHRLIHRTEKTGALKMWFQAATEDEKSDRNNNGIIDAIDDTLDLITALEEKGYRKDVDIRYVEVEGGKHHPKTWAKVLPDFLTWIFPEKRLSLLGMK